jgi:hypothetical protein
MAKFGYRIDPELWSDDPATEDRKRTELETDRKRNEAARHKDVHDSLENDEVPTPPDLVPGLAAPPAATIELIDDYGMRRLEYQLAVLPERAIEYLKLP